MKRFMFLLSILFLLALNLSPLYTQIIREDLDELQNIDVEEHLGDKIPLNLTFVDDKGEITEISKFFNQGKPVILVMAYYNCPMLCTLVLNGLSKGIQDMALDAGKDYQILTVSIDPTETPQLAAAKKRAQIGETNKNNLDAAWHFFVGNNSSIRKLADAIGFKYYYVEERKEFAHPAVLVLLTPDGTISRYLYGIDFPEINMRLGLLEASEGKIGSTIDKLILFCYHYDPNANGYVMFASNVMKLGGVATLVFLGIFIGSFWLRESRKKKTSLA